MGDAELEAQETESAADARSSVESEADEQLAQGAADAEDDYEDVLASERAEQRRFDRIDLPPPRTPSKK